MKKFQFIKSILENNKFGTDQKERFLKLVSKELTSLSVLDDEVKSEIEKINLRLNTLEVGNKVEDKNKNKRKKIFHEANPKHVADFMFLFNKRDGLKYLTHDFDEDEKFHIDKFLSSAYEVFKIETNSNLRIPNSLWRIVKQFAFDSQQTEWTSISENYTQDINVKIGWATKELREWSKKENLHPIRNEEYKTVIDHFKRITKIESTNLLKLINTILPQVFKNELTDFEIEKDDKNLSKADFYTHVRFFKDALVTIFEEIKERSDSNEKKKITIKYERESDEGYYLRKIVITHHNSFPVKELGVFLSEWKEKGNMGKIERKLKGYCHWSVETMIEGRPTRVNILKDEQTPPFDDLVNNSDKIIEGFTHVLTFYYK